MQTTRRAGLLRHKWHSSPARSLINESQIMKVSRASRLSVVSMTLWSFENAVCQFRASSFTCSLLYVHDAIIMIQTYPHFCFRCKWLRFQRRRLTERLLFRRSLGINQLQSISRTTTTAQASLLDLWNYNVFISFVLLYTRQ